MATLAQQIRNACWFSKLPDAGECEGPQVIRCHLISQQQMRITHPKGYAGRALAVLQADPRGWVWGCGGTSGLAGHHGKLDTAPHDSSKLRIPRAMLPPELEEFAYEMNLTWWLDRTYGEA
jgi:hypothetical protein